MTPKESTALAVPEPRASLPVVPATDFPGLASGEDLKLMLAENLGQGGISRRDLPKIRIPLGGGKMWVLPTAEGEERVVKTISAIVLAHQAGRLYWAQESSAETTPPDCSSEDATHGVGNPGGDCRVCPLAQFGTKSNGRGQACKLVTSVYLFERGQDAVLPSVLQLPPGSQKSWRQYLLALINRRKAVSGVVTEIGLSPQDGPGGQKYSVATFTLAGEIDADTAAAAKAFGAAIKSAT